MKYLLLILAVALAGCGGKVANSEGMDSQKSLVEHRKATAADYQNSVQALYIAYFGRPADPAGLTNFSAALQAANAPDDLQSLALAYGSDTAIKSLIDSFSASQESQNLYGSGNTTAFVTAVYRNVFNRAPATAGLNFWVTAIDSGALTKSDAALSIASGAMSNTSTQGQQDALLLNNRLSIAAAFTAQLSLQQGTSAYVGASSATVARNFLASVTASTNTTAYQSNVNAVVSAIIGGITISGTYTVKSTPYEWLQWGLGYEAVGVVMLTEFADENIYQVDSQSLNLVLTDYQHSPDSWAVLNGLTLDLNGNMQFAGQKVGYIDTAAQSSGMQLPIMKYSVNGQIGTAQIMFNNGSYSFYCGGCAYPNPVATPGAAVESVVHSFSGTSTDVAYPSSPMMQWSDGNFYGVTEEGQGGLYAASAAGAERVAGTIRDKGWPQSGFTANSDGFFYATAGYTAYRIPAGGGDEQLMFGFSSAFGSAVSAMTVGQDGLLYGVTSYSPNKTGGTVYRVQTHPATYIQPASFTLTLVYQFPSNVTPATGLVLGKDGAFYGVASGGGANGNGYVYKLTTDGTATTLYSFGSAPDAQYPTIQPQANVVIHANLLLAADGNLYGTVPKGGTNGSGALFKVSSTGQGSVVYSFDSTQDAAGISGMIQASDGNLYGTAAFGGAIQSGSIFRVTPGGNYTLLYSFGVPPDGQNPTAGLIQATDGNLYGTTFYGGAYNFGTIFKLEVPGLATANMLKIDAKTRRALPGGSLVFK